MSKCGLIREIIEELFVDGEIHTIDELNEIAIERKIIESRKDSSVKNALYQMQRRNKNFVRRGKGEYQIKNVQNNSLEDIQNLDKAISVICDVVFKLEKFNWINSTDEEVFAARNEVSKIKELNKTISSIIK